MLSEFARGKSPQARTDYTSSHGAWPLQLVIAPELAGLRLDQALARLLPQHSRSRLQSWIKSGQVLLEGERAEPKCKLWGGEKISVAPTAACEQLAHRAQPIALDILFEDDVLVVINKPPRLVVHPGAGNWEGTLLNALLHHAPQLESIPRAGIVHRLDKDTSGAMVVAKTLVAQTALVRQLQARTMRREYLALVEGVVQSGGTIEAPIGRHPAARTRMAVVGKGKPAVTHYRVVERFAGHTLLECTLETGRTHQIRVHLQTIGHAVAGDPVYRGRNRDANPACAQLLKTFGRQALHAARLGLRHPTSGAAMSWKAPLPSDMALLLQALRNAA
jgi:23S rRNA pseudouridine1911/1915/1917 synthase